MGGDTPGDTGRRCHASSLMVVELTRRSQGAAEFALWDASHAGWHLKVLLQVRWRDWT